MDFEVPSSNSIKHLSLSPGVKLKLLFCVRSVSEISLNLLPISLVMSARCNERDLADWPTRRRP